MDKNGKTPSVYTLVYWLIQDKKIAPEDLFNFLELYWPTFVMKNGSVFLKEKFSDEEYNRLTNEKVNPEYWINLLTVDDFFFNTDNEEEKSIVFAKRLMETWQEKLKKDFPAMSFIVEYLHDEECGDYGLTFYQKK